MSARSYRGTRKFWYDCWRLDRLEGRKNFDLIADYALPLPVTVISDLLGVPKGDQAKFARWSHALIKAGAAAPLSALMLMPSIVAFMRYLKTLIAMKRTAPADDLVIALVQAEEAGDRLGVTGYDYSSWIALFSLKGTHDAVTAKLKASATQVLAEPDLAPRLRAAGLFPWFQTPDRVTKAISEDDARWKDVVKTANITL